MSASETVFPARLHVLLARDARTGVVIRRGPSKTVCTIGWDRETDRFRVGQWLRGRIYERRSDLSPDGRHLVYFAYNGKPDTDTNGSWTAISRAPYLKAVGLWGKGDAWHGGGLFVDDRTVWLNHGYGQTELSKPAGLREAGDNPFPGGRGGECLSVYYPKLLRDGWTHLEHSRLGRWHHLDVFEKSVGAGWVLRKSAHGTTDHPVGTGCYFDRHELVHQSIGQSVCGAGWEWADTDGDRLVWAAWGRLYAGRVRKSGLFGVSVLYDFNPMAFAPLTAPY